MILPRIRYFLLSCVSAMKKLFAFLNSDHIYEEAIDAMLKKWDTSRSIQRDEIYHMLSLDKKRKMFARIAAETFEAGEYLIEQKKLEIKVASYMKSLPSVESDEDIDGVAVIKAIEAQYGIFVERAYKIHSFSHLSFQEYFTAKYIVTHYKDTLEPLIYNHCFDEVWREVFLLTAEMLDDAESFFEIFLNALDAFVSQNKGLEKFLLNIQ